MTEPEIRELVESRVRRHEIEAATISGIASVVMIGFQIVVGAIALLAYLKCH